MKKVLFFTILLSTISLSARYKVLVSSIPKSGTHLIRKCLELMFNEKEVAFSDSWRNVIKLVGNGSKSIKYGAQNYTTNFMEIGRAHV